MLGTALLRRDLEAAANRPGGSGEAKLDTAWLSRLENERENR